MPIQGGFVYILVNSHNTVFYVGVAASISSRLDQHRKKLFPKSFTSKYNINKIVYYEFFDAIEDAIQREKQVKKYSRVKKIELIVKKNPKWEDLYDEVKYL
jgi:putative endonuclease